MAGVPEGLVVVAVGREARTIRKYGGAEARLVGTAVGAEGAVVSSLENC